VLKLGEIKMKVISNNIKRQMSYTTLSVPYKNVIIPAIFRDRDILKSRTPKGKRSSVESLYSILKMMNKKIWDKKLIMKRRYKLLQKNRF
jgi:hypothetical protein